MMKNVGFRKTTAVILMMALAALLFLGGCASETDKKEVERITLSVVVGGGPTAVSMAKMLEDTKTLGENVSINYTVAKGADLLTAKVLSGEGDFVMLASNVAAKLYNEKVPYQVAAANTWGVLYLVSNGVEINSFKDLKGREIASLAKGATPDIQLRYFLEKSGLDPDKDVKIVYRAGHEEAARYMIAEKDKLAVLPEPWVSLAQAKNLPYLLAGVSTALGMTWKAVISAEVLSQPGLGIGTNLERAKSYLETPRVLAWTAVAVGLSYLSESVWPQFIEPFPCWKRCS